MRKRSVFALVAVGVAGVVVIAVPAIAGSGPTITDGDKKSAEGALLNGLATSQSVLAPPGASSTLGARQLLAMKSDTALRTGMKTKASSTLSRYFRGQALKDVLKAADSGIDAQANPDFRVLGGGADTMQVSTAEVVDANTLRLTGTVRMWSSVAQVQSATVVVPASPSNIVDFQATMIRQADGSWAVSDYTWSFHSGSEP
jgi:hypothetical protein